MRKNSGISVILIVLASLLWYCSKDDFSTPAAIAEEKALTPEEPGDVLSYPILPLSVCDQQLTTFTQADWGAPLRGQLAVNYLYKGFYEVFGPEGEFGPEWLTVGCDYKNRIFTSPEAVSDFLPYIKGVVATGNRSGEEQPYPLVGEVTALSLNVHYDLVFPKFGASGLHLKDLILINTRTRYDGWTVEQILYLGNQVLGGCFSIDQFVQAELHSAVTKVNRNYQYGEVNRGYLNCPPVPFRELETIEFLRE